MKNFTYLVVDEKTKDAAVIDPGWEINKILDIGKAEKFRVIYIVNTHDHLDHSQGNLDIKKLTGAKIIAHVNSGLPKDIGVKDGDTFKIGNLDATILHTPGHSQDSICILIEDILLTGDTLFVGECGRTDLLGGSSEDMYDSLFNKLMKLPNKIKIYPGHDYGKIHFSTIGDEKKNNYVLKPRSLIEFKRFMESP